MIISPKELDLCRNGNSGNPHQWLGMHLLADRPGLVVRAWDPGAQEIALVDQKSKKSYQMIKIHEDGFFEFYLARRRKVFPYFFYSTYENGERKWLDPYSFEPSFDNSAYAKFNHGRDRRPFDKMGAIPLTIGGVDGVAFVVWAPAAKSVHLVGDFNH